MPVALNLLRKSVNSLLDALHRGTARRNRLRRRRDLASPITWCAEVLEPRALLSAPTFGSGFDVQFQAAGGATDSGGNAVAADAAGNSYVAGIFNGSGDMDPGPGVHTLVNSNPAKGGGSYNGFFAKYDAGGNFQWVTPLITSSGRADATGVAGCGSSDARESWAISWVCGADYGCAGNDCCSLRQ